jgi:hypothetical protein
MAVRKEMCCQAEGDGDTPYDDDDAGCAMFKGMYERDCGNMIEALSLFEEARTKNPKVYTAWNNVAQI